jgi:hypothetical protein
LKYLNLGNSGTTAQVLNHESAHHYAITATGNFTLSFSNWPANDTGVILLDLVNGGSFTITLPTINFIKPNGTTTTSLTEYLAALGISGRTTLQAAGTDRFVFWSIAGATPCGRIVA